MPRVAPSTFRFLVGLAAGAGAFALWWRFMDGPRAWAVATHASLPLLAAGAGVLVLTQVVRLFRWAFLLRRVGAVSLGRVFRLLAAGEFVNNYLPVRIGELGRIVALSGTGGFTASSATASVVVDRLWGVGVRLLVLPLLVLVPGRVPKPVAISAAIFAGALAASLGGLLFYARRRDLSLRLLRVLLHVVPSRWRPAVERAATGFGDSTLAMSLSPGAALTLFALSAGGMLLQAAAIACFFAAVGAPIPAATAIVGVALVDLLAVVPSPPAGLGTAEWFPTIVYSIGFGMPRAQTAAAALLVHASWILLVTVAGAFSLATIAEMMPRRAATPARTPPA